MIDGISMFMFHRFPDLFFPLYRNLSKKWIGLLSYISSPFPFAVWDILLIVLIIVLIVSLIIVIKKKKSILKYLSALFFILSLMAFAAVMGWMLNHYAAPLSESINLDVKEYSVEQLYEACDYYLQKASSYTLSVERDENGKVTEVLCTYQPDSKGGNPADGHKVKGATIHWVDQASAVDAEVRLYSYLFSDPDPDGPDKNFLDALAPDSLQVLTGCKVEAALADIPMPEKGKDSEGFQFMRQGYFCLDNKDAAPGRLVFNRSVALKDSFR